MLYCWFDTEYTNLDLTKAEILQVALIITDVDLRPLDLRPPAIPPELLRPDGFVGWLTPPGEELLSDYVREHFQPLLATCRARGRTPAQIDDLLTSYVDAAIQTTGTPDLRPILAGNTVHADAILAQRYLPRFSGRLHYRLLDVTTLKIEWQYHHRRKGFSKDPTDDGVSRYYTGSEPVLGERHDAYYDVQASIAELAYYRNATA